MLVYQAALVVCLLLLFSVSFAQTVALHSGRKEQAHVLRIFRLGLGLSACSYALRLLGASPNSPATVFSFFLCGTGTALIWIGWREQRRLQRAHSPHGVTLLRSEDAGTNESLNKESLSLEALSIPVRTANPSVLDAGALRVLCHAQEEARRRRQSCVDTDHLLLGLLCEPRCTGVCVLEHLGIPRERLYMGLTEVWHDAQAMPLTPLKQPPELTHRTRQVLVMAAQEAYRFEKTEIGTEHLLLGLLLIGSGPAAAALFREGVTVDRLRHEIIKKK